jgi:hypothetical protein
VTFYDLKFLIIALMQLGISTASRVTQIDELITGTGCTTRKKTYARCVIYFHFCPRVY